MTWKLSKSESKIAFRYDSERGYVHGVAEHSTWRGAQDIHGTPKRDSAWIVTAYRDNKMMLYQKVKKKSTAVMLAKAWMRAHPNE